MLFDDSEDLGCAFPLPEEGQGHDPVRRAAPSRVELLPGASRLVAAAAWQPGRAMRDRLRRGIGARPSAAALVPRRANRP